MNLRWLVFENHDGSKDDPILQAWDEQFEAWEEVPTETVRLRPLDKEA